MKYSGGLRGTVEQALVALGGMASGSAISEQLMLDKIELSPRRVKDVLKGGRNVRPLGAGLYALNDNPAEPLEEFVATVQRELSLETQEEIEASIVEAYYPYASATSVRSWYLQR